MKNNNIHRLLIIFALMIMSISSHANEGRTISARIIGGNEVNNASTYPWMVSIKSSTDTDEAGGHFCGGTLISDQWVLTAAHCFSDISFAHEIIVTVGEYDLLSLIPTPSNNASDIIIHEDFNPDTFDNDIALIKLSFPVNNTFLPLLSSRETFTLSESESTTATTLGWGLTDENDDSSFVTILNDVSLPLLSSNTCENYVSGFTDNMICAGDILEGGIDACQGDSGGPLVVNSIADNETQQIGIVSFGDGCGQSGNPGVYTKVANYTAWIRLNITPPSTNYFVADVNETRIFTITYKNESQETISPTFSLPNNESFSLITTQCDALAPNETCDISFEYTPNAYQIEAANILVSSNDGDTNIEITGTAMEIVSANDITFSENSDVTWYQSNTLPWLPSEDGESILSPDIGNDEITQLTAIVSGDQVLSFNWAISSEQDFDSLNLLINGVVIDQISGEQDFTPKEYILSGDNTVITWQYKKNASVSNGQDSAFLKNVRIAPVAPVTSTTNTDTNEDRGEGGGGSMQWWILLLLIGFLLYQRRTKRLSTVQYEHGRSL